MKYKGIFLDLDGTILNTIEDIRAAVNFALKQYGYKERTLEQIRQSIGRGSIHLIKTSLPSNIDENTFQSIFDTYKNYYINNVNVFTKPYNNVKETLKYFKDNGIKIAIITNKPHDLASELIDIHFKNLVDLVVGIKEGVTPKPDPSSLNQALRQLRLTNKEVLFIGDSLVDYKTAKNGSLDVIICLYGFEIENILKENCSCPLIKSFEEIRRYL